MSPRNAPTTDWCLSSRFACWRFCPQLRSPAGSSGPAPGAPQPVTLPRLRLALRCQRQRCSPLEPLRCTGEPAQEGWVLSWQVRGHPGRPGATSAEPRKGEFLVRRFGLRPSPSHRSGLLQRGDAKTGHAGCRGSIFRACHPVLHRAPGGIAHHKRCRRGKQGAPRLACPPCCWPNLVAMRRVAIPKHQLRTARG